MAEDTEKRFHSIMDKLFHCPKSNSNTHLSASLSSAEKRRGEKRPFSAIETNSAPCRPWDRGDLMRRLATFKSMTWFAKPKSVDAVNCARRGWTNVDMDIIACRNCGARLQFSTPSAWNQEQVEKAALVFSLKLDSGHKLLCPWIDNACDENLALFPPLPAPVLVDHYKQRSSALMQLSALPVISASVIESLRNPQLEFFLKHSITMECGAAPNDSSLTECFGNDIGVVSSDLYYQALKLLSLCGWEPRSLPYVVDCEGQPKLSSTNGDASSLSRAITDEQNNRLSVYMSNSSEIIRAGEDFEASRVYDPNSTVLDCKCCGASIGLWAFEKVPRPLELVRVVGYAETGAGDDIGSKSTADNNHANKGKSDTSIANEVGTRSTLLNMTIAGGPPPAKQNFRATISLPVIGRVVRNRLCSLSSDLSTDVEKPIPSDAITEGSTKDTQNETECDISCHGIKENALTTTITDSSNPLEIPVGDGDMIKETSSLADGNEKVDGVRDGRSSDVQKDASTLTIEKDVLKYSSYKKMEFHAIRQHRYFCPWVTSMNNNNPGWQQTLFALQKEKVFLVPELEGSPSSSSLFKVDDPITSIRRLFESPPTKRQKPAST